MKTDHMYVVICRLDRQDDGSKGRYSLCRTSRPEFFSDKQTAVAYAKTINPSREPIVLRAVVAPFGASS